MDCHSKVHFRLHIKCVLHILLLLNLFFNFIIIYYDRNWIMNAVSAVSGSNQLCCWFNWIINKKKKNKKKKTDSAVGKAQCKRVLHSRFKQPKSDLIQRYNNSVSGGALILDKSSFHNSKTSNISNIDANCTDGRLRSFAFCWKNKKQKIEKNSLLARKYVIPLTAIEIDSSLRRTMK